jgi:tRNA threonylcarbamoyladenosine biosynthesis protein TsaE
LVIETSSPEETLDLGRKIGVQLKAKDILALSGPLGAGKTTLIQGIALGLGVTDYVTSPTFILINEYLGRIPLYHIDLYRLEDLSQIEDLGIEEYFDKPGAAVIEWAEKLGDLLPEKAKNIKIEITGENSRKIWQSWV